MQEENIKKVRKEIDKLDSTIVELLNKRKNLIILINKYKEKHNLSILDKKREKEILKKLPNKYEQNIFKKILKESRKIQKINKKQLPIEKNS